MAGLARVMIRKIWSEACRVLQVCVASLTVSNIKESASGHRMAVECLLRTAHAMTLFSQDVELSIATEQLCTYSVAFLDPGPPIEVEVQCVVAKGRFPIDNDSFLSHWEIFKHPPAHPRSSPHLPRRPPDRCLRSQRMVRRRRAKSCCRQLRSQP